MRSSPIDIIVPVYDGRRETLACLVSVIDSLLLNRRAASLLVIFDGGPDQALQEELLELASHRQIRLLINDSNIGFVRSVNRGMQQNPERDVILLNSDTMVAGDWLDRMVEAAAADERIATVTPFSNNAEICSWPRLCQVNRLPPGLTVANVDASFASLGPRVTDIPTAVGFCMFIRRSCIDAIGIFNAAVFGRGYGEENDFCMRATSRGYRHVLACNVFVFHHGGISFSTEKHTRVQNAITLLNRMYPSYASLVAAHIEEDPARKWRFAAELACHQRRGLPLVLHISHGIGGGTDKHVVELANHLKDQAQHAMLVPQSDCARLVFPNVVSGGLFEFGWNRLDEMTAMLHSLNLSKLHIHHVKGWEFWLEIVLAKLDRPYDLTIHDYYYLHINPALSDSQGRFCPREELRDRLCAEAIPFPSGQNAGGWRERWAGLLAGARRVFAPSRAAAQIYQSYFPNLQIDCLFHPDWERDAPYPAVTSRGLQRDEALHVVVLGALSVIKGADLMEKVALLAAERGVPLKFTLAGYAYKKLHGSITALGAYSDADLPNIVKGLKPHVIWFPCTWPETYSYTLSHALKAGCPVLCPDLGAFPERLVNRPMSWCQRWDADPETMLARLLELRESFSEAEQRAEWANQPVVPALPSEAKDVSAGNTAQGQRSVKSYRQLYLGGGSRGTERLKSGIESWDQLMRCWQPQIGERRNLNRWLLRRLLWLNNHAFFGSLANVIPMHVRRTVKRKLSTGPLHE